MAFSRAIPRHLVAMVIAALLTRSSLADTDAQQCNSVADILFILDSSSSIGQANYDLMKTFVETLIDKFTIGQGKFQFSLIIFSNSVTTVFNFGQYNSKDDLQTAIRNTPYIGGGTNTADALKQAWEVSFTSTSGARQNTKKLAIVMTDGASNDARETANEAQSLKDSGASVIAIGVGQNVDRTELQTIASNASFVYEVANFTVLDAIKGSLVNTTCKASVETDTCIRESCYGRRSGNYPACNPECKKGYFYSCSNELTYRMDCALGWYTRKDGTLFLAKLVFNPSTNTCEREVPQCSRDPEDYVVTLPPPTNTNQNAGPLPSPTDPNQNAGPLPSPSIDGAVTCINSSCYGRRNGNYLPCESECKKGYFISCSNEYAYKMDCPLGRYVSKSGYNFYARLVYNPPTDSCERETLYCPRNPEDYVVPVPSTQPPPISPSVNRPCLRSPSDCLGNPDGNYPMCYPECQKGLFYYCSNNAATEISCALAWYTDSQQQRFVARMVYDPQTGACQMDSTSCPRQTTNSGPATTTPPPVPVCKAQSDVLFIMDSSGSITSENYATMVAFVANLTQHFSLGLDSVLVSAMIFSNDVSIVFNFTAHLDNAGLYQAILSVPYYEAGTNTAQALTMARESAFRSTNGARESVNKVAVVLTDGISNNPAETAIQAELLRLSEVKILAIGIGEGIVYSELNAIASSPSQVFNVSGFDVLSTIIREVVITTCETLPATLPPSTLTPSTLLPSSTLSPCVSGSCSNTPDGTYAACPAECVNGHYYVCTNGSAQKQTCDMMVITENGQTFTVRGVYDPDLQACQGRSNACPGNK